MCFWGSSLKRGMAVTYYRFLYLQASNYVVSFFALDRFRYSDSQVFTGDLSNFYGCLWLDHALSGSWRPSLGWLWVVKIWTPLFIVTSVINIPSNSGWWGAHHLEIKFHIYIYCLNAVSNASINVATKSVSQIIGTQVRAQRITNHASPRRST